jgi:hypothetical protein
MPAKKGADDESETMLIRWTVYRIQLKMPLWIMRIHQANLQIASTALLTLGFLGSVSVRPCRAPERQRRKAQRGAPQFLARDMTA